MAKADILPKTIQRVLPCKLTDEELRARGDELVKLLSEEEELEQPQPRHVGWFFISRQRYEDTGETYLRGAWVTVLQS